MSPATMKEAMMNRLLALVMLAAALLLTAAAHAAAPGIKGTTFNLTAGPAYISQPDGQAVYSWGYGCTGGTPGSAAFAPPATLMPGATCPTMQIPGPTLIVTQNQTVTVTLTNNLPTAAGNTSILFPGFQVTTTNGVVGLLTHEAAPGGTVTYSFTASSPGTHAYYSGTQGDLQVEMGLYGAIIVLPASVPAACTAGLHASKKRTGMKVIFGWRRPRTATPEPATTGSTCSSSPRWIPTFTARRWRKSPPGGTARRAPWAAVSRSRPSLTTPRTS